MKRKYQQAFETEECSYSKRQKLNNGTIKVVNNNYEQIQQLISNQQKIIKEFGKVIRELKEELINNKNKIKYLEEVVEELTCPPKFSSPASYIY